jgi:molybdopterin synthase catalytic subunit
MIITITDQPLDLQALIEAVTTDANGGVVAFLGLVRRWNDAPDGQSREVHWLEYEAYKEAAEEVMRDIARQVEEKWGLTSLAMAHRVGHLAVGEPAVAVAVGAPHRGAAFEACEFAIDTLKATVPIWKKESWENGANTGQSWVVNKETLTAE